MRSPTSTSSPPCFDPATHRTSGAPSRSSDGSSAVCVRLSPGRASASAWMPASRPLRSSPSSKSKQTSTTHVAMPKNSVLLRRIKKLMRKARRLSRESGQTAHVYGECRYAARSWGKKRRLIVKAEVVRHPGREPKENPRFVVTNLAQTPKWIYERVYCERGDAENRIKELHLGLETDRTSCSSFWANQLRLLLTAAAYVLMQELRLRAARTSCARAQVQTLRERLIKIGARVVESVRRVVLHLPASYPFLEPWRRVATSLGATAG